MDTLRKVLIYVSISDNENFDEYKYLLGKLPRTKQQRINAYRKDIDKKLSLFADLLVRSYVCDILGEKNFRLQFVKNIYGKPELLNYSGLKYNVSHTKNAIIIGFASDEIGVDIEKNRTYDLEIAKRFFTQNEYLHVLNSNFNNRFIEIWTKKEAYVKWLGQGFNKKLSSFDVLDEEISKKIFTFLFDDYVISVCGYNMMELDKFVVFNEETAKQYIDKCI